MTHAQRPETSTGGSRAPHAGSPEAGDAPQGAPGPVAERPWRGPDRRARPTPRISRWAFGPGRRRAARRQEEREGIFVDLYSSRLVLLIGWVALMNIADSGFTLVHLQAGGRELNPVADWMLTTGRLGFVAVKSTLIAAALLVLAMHVNFPLARLGLWVSAGAYTLLVAYHISLFYVA